MLCSTDIILGVGVRGIRVISTRGLEHGKSAMPGSSEHKRLTDSIELINYIIYYYLQYLSNQLYQGIYSPFMQGLFALEEYFPILILP